MSALIFDFNYTALKYRFTFTYAVISLQLLAKGLKHRLLLPPGHKYLVKVRPGMTAGRNAKTQCFVLIPILFVAVARVVTSKSLWVLSLDY